MRQSQVQAQSAPAVPGDFASSNPRATKLAGPGGLIAGSGPTGYGLAQGLFAWVDPSLADEFGGARVIVNARPAGVTGAPDCFIHRQMANGTFGYLRDEYSMFIPAGVAVEAFTSGEFWVRNTGAPATVGMKAFVEITTGLVQFRAAGTTVAGLVETKWFARSAGGTAELVKISDNSPAGGVVAFSDEPEQQPVKETKVGEESHSKTPTKAHK